MIYLMPKAIKRLLENKKNKEHYFFVVINMKFCYFCNGNIENQK